MPKDRAHKDANVFIISDTHFPFHSHHALEKCLRLIEKERPTHVVQVGDLLDQYIFSKYSRSLVVTAESDILSGLTFAEEMWAEVQRLVPKVQCHQLLGNHDMRLSKRIAEKLPEMEEFFSHKHLYKFDGVKVLESDRDYLEIDGVVYCHGWYIKLGDHINYFRKSVVHGHTHKPGLLCKGELFELDCGYMADGHSLPLQYTPSKFSGWRTSCGQVERGAPRLHLL